MQHPLENMFAPLVNRLLMTLAQLSNEHNATATANAKAKALHSNRRRRIAGSNGQQEALQVKVANRK